MLVSSKYDSSRATCSFSFSQLRNSLILRIITLHFSSPVSSRIRPEFFSCSFCRSCSTSINPLLITPALKLSSEISFSPSIFTPEKVLICCCNDRSKEVCFRIKDAIKISKIFVKILLDSVLAGSYFHEIFVVSKNAELCDLTKFQLQEYKAIYLFIT